jgi:hypothetical protein
LNLFIVGRIEDWPKAGVLSACHIGETSERMTECQIGIGKTFFSRFQLKGKKELKHPVVCGMTHQTTKQYSK